jgi:hypothetical protein
MEKEKWYQMSLLGVIVASIVSILILTNQKDTKIKELQTQNDELITQNFVLQTDIGRYEMGIDIFKERDSSGGKQLEEILNKETE